MKFSYTLLVGFMIRPSYNKFRWFKPSLKLNLIIYFCGQSILLSINPTTKHICYIVSNGFAARMVLQTDLLLGLQAAGIKVTLFCIDPDDRAIQSYCKAHQIELLGFDSKGILTHPKYQLLRTYFLEDLYANAALMEKHHYQVSFDNNGSSKRWNLLWRCLLALHPMIRKSRFIPLLFNWVETSMLRAKKLPASLQKIQGDLFVSSYPANPHESILLYQAQRLGIKTCIHLLSWDNISCKGRFYTKADEYISWGPIMTEEFQTFYQIPKEKIHECGVSHFDLHERIFQSETKNEYFEKIGLDKKNPIIFFGMSSPRFVPNEIDIVETVAKWVEKNEFGDKIQLVVRPHPQNVTGSMSNHSWLDRLKEIESPRVRLFYPSMVESDLPWSMEIYDMYAMSSILKPASVCINSCSTLSIDALMLEVPNIAPMYDGYEKERSYWNSARRLLDYTHIAKFIKAGGTFVCKNEHDLKNKIQDCIQDRANQYKYCKPARYIETGDQKGDATERIISSLKSML